MRVETPEGLDRTIVVAVNAELHVQLQDVAKAWSEQTEAQVTPADVVRILIATAHERLDPVIAASH